MYKFRKLPIEIQAFQMTKERRWDNSQWPEWLNYAWQKEAHELGAVYCTDLGDDRLWIKTLEGHQVISWDDWIIEGVAGELYPCKPGIFFATYEPVEED